VEARNLVNGSTIIQADHVGARLEYINVELEGHAVIYANAVPVETYRPTHILAREALENFSDFVRLYPGEEYKSFPSYAAHRRTGRIHRIATLVGLT
jgi:hypothetical protein